MKLSALTTKDIHRLDELYLNAKRTGAYPDVVRYWLARWLVDEKMAALDTQVAERRAA